VIVLLDTDVLIDVALDRSSHAEPAAALLDVLEHGAAAAFMAWHTISNFYYLVSPKRGKPDAKSFLVDLSRFVDVTKTSTESLRYAARLQMKDFEDAMQVAAATACGADFIATRNARDYDKSPIQALTPEFLLDELAQI
jgi:predicted nucleic acid-binding protein